VAGANIGSLNALLAPFGIAMGNQRVLSGEFILDKREMVLDGATEIVQFPKDGFLISTPLKEEPESFRARIRDFED
jgi:hypothetical protein